MPRSKGRTPLNFDVLLTGLALAAGGLSYLMLNAGGLKHDGLTMANAAIEPARPAIRGAESPTRPDVIALASPGANTDIQIREADPLDLKVGVEEASAALDTGFQSFDVPVASDVWFQFRNLPREATVRLMENDGVLASWGGDHRGPRLQLDPGQYRVELELAVAAWNGEQGVEVHQYPVGAAAVASQAQPRRESSPSFVEQVPPQSPALTPAAPAPSRQSSPVATADGAVGGAGHVRLGGGNGAAGGTSAPAPSSTARSRPPAPATPSAVSTPAASPSPAVSPAPAASPVATASPVFKASPAPATSPAPTATPAPATSPAPVASPAPSAPPTFPSSFPIDSLLDVPSRGVFGTVFNNTVIISGVDSVQVTGGTNVRVLNGLAVHDGILVPPSRTAGLDSLFNTFGGNTATLIPANRQRPENSYIVLQMDPGSADLKLYSRASDPANPNRTLIDWSPVVTREGNVFGTFD